MTQQIPREKWKSFFDYLSKQRYEWRTKVEVLSSSIGDQTLVENLPLNGITVEEKDDDYLIEIIIGLGEANHQTHTIRGPSAIRYLTTESDDAGIVEIEEPDGTKTMVNIIEPMNLKIKAAPRHEIAVP